MKTYKEYMRMMEYESIKCKAKVRCYKTTEKYELYHIIDNPENLSNDELALICSKGNLKHGYETLGSKLKIFKGEKDERRTTNSIFKRK